MPCQLALSICFVNFEKIDDGIFLLGPAEF